MLIWNFYFFHFPALLESQLPIFPPRLRRNQERSVAENKTSRCYQYWLVGLVSQLDPPGERYQRSMIQMKIWSCDFGRRLFQFWPDCGECFAPLSQKIMKVQVGIVYSGKCFAPLCNRMSCRHEYSVVSRLSECYRNLTIQCGAKHSPQSGQNEKSHRPRSRLSIST